MIAPPSYLYEVSSARAPEGFHSVKEEPQRKDFQVDFPFENPTGYKKPTARNLKLDLFSRFLALHKLELFGELGIFARQALRRL